jgi:hypothetical protein
MAVKTSITVFFRVNITYPFMFFIILTQGKTLVKDGGIQGGDKYPIPYGATNPSGSADASPPPFEQGRLLLFTFLLCIK